METTKSTIIKVNCKIQAPVEIVWKLWTTPEHITRWNNATEDWHTPVAENDLRVGGKFLSRMEAKDGSAGFDFSGVYTEVDTYKRISYILEDGRKVKIIFSGYGNETEITETFEAENINTVDLQRNGWQSILDNFKSYVESF